MDLVEKLSEVECRYEKITSEMSSPDVLADMDEYRKLTREHAELQEIVDAYRYSLDLERKIKDAQTLLDDPDLKKLAKAEVEESSSELDAVKVKLTALLIPKDPLDEKNVILEIRAGTGGEEAGLFAADLYRMYSRYAEENGWRVEELSSNTTGIGGIKEIVSLIKGIKVYSRLKFESGIHRVQRVPTTESGGRIHTSAVTVAVLPEADDVDVDVRPEDIRIDVFRASGAGGQHVNKTESAVRLTHIPSGIVVACQDEKSQHKNKLRAMKILNAKLFDHAQQEADDERSDARRTLVGSGDRSGRIRTYNYPQGRVTDHRINLTLYRLPEILEGDLGPVVEALATHAQAEILSSDKS